MLFSNVAINITGPSSKARSRFLSNQKTLNLYPEAVGKDFILNSFPGLTLFSAGSAACRGAFEHLNIMYQVMGETLYSISIFGTRTALGSIPGTARCIFAGIGTSIVVVTEGKAYHWNGSALSEVVDADLETPNSCAHLNNQIIYDGDGGRFASADVGDATSINGLNYGTAEINADDLIRVFTYDQLVYLFGDKTIETWWNSGTGNPPFERIEGGAIPVGLGALHSVASNDSGIYFLGDDRNIYFMKGQAHQSVTPIPLASEIEGFDIIDDAQGNAFSALGQNFYVITFPSEQRSFCYNESVGIENGWFELSSETSETKRYLGSSFVYFNKKTYVTDADNGNIYELSKDAYDENGVAILRIRDTGTLSGEDFGRPGKEVTLNRLELIMETGVGTSGQGADPVVMMKYSDDGGRTWSTEQWAKVGQAGNFILKVEWFDLGTFLRRIFRFSMTDPVFWCIKGGAIDVEVGI